MLQRVTMGIRYVGSHYAYSAVSNTPLVDIHDYII